MRRAVGLSAWVVCLLTIAVRADESVLDHPLFPLPTARVVVDAKAKVTAGALEIMPPCYARQLQGTRLEVNTSRGWGWVERGQMLTPAEAEKYCAAHANDAYGLYVRAQLHLMAERDDQALADLSRAIQRDPALAAAYCSRGNLYAIQGNNEKALADFTQAVKVAPRDLLAANELAWFRATCADAKFRNGKQAVAEATRVCEATGYQHEEFLDTLAASCAEAGDYKSAVKWATKASELDPENEDFQAHQKLFQASKPLRDEVK